MLRVSVPEFVRFNVPLLKSAEISIVLADIVPLVLLNVPLAIVISFWVIEPVLVVVPFNTKFVPVIVPLLVKLSLIKLLLAQVLQK